MAPAGQKFPAPHGIPNGPAEQPAGQKYPPAHARHVAGEAAPATAEKVPAGHSVQLGAPVAANVPAAQAAQAAAALAPAEGENLPAVQLVQEGAPAREYLPAGHSAGVAVPKGHSYPSGHRPVQAATGRALVAPKRPAAQAVHAEAPAREYEPAAHGTSVALVEPAAHAKPAWQGPVQALTASPAVAP